MKVLEQSQLHKDQTETLNSHISVFELHRKEEDDRLEETVRGCYIPAVP